MTTLILEISDRRVIPEDKKITAKIRRQSARFLVIGTELYRRGYWPPLQKCIGEGDAAHILAEVHKGTFKSNIRSEALASVILRQGYFWPMMRDDAKKLENKCQKWQEQCFKLFDILNWLKEVNRIARLNFERDQRCHVNHRFMRSTKMNLRWNRYTDVYSFENMTEERLKSAVVILFPSSEETSRLWEHYTIRNEN